MSVFPVINFHVETNYFPIFFHIMIFVVDNATHFLCKNSNVFRIVIPLPIVKVILMSISCIAIDGFAVHS